MIRVFVGTDPRQKKAEVVLEHSIRKHTRSPVEITWMRAGDPGFDDWAGTPDYPMQEGKPWATCFTLFRYAIPELCDFKGRAIYLDSDMMVLGDISELWNLPMTEGKPWLTKSLKRTDVSLLNCEGFASLKWWPFIDQIKTWTDTHYQVRQKLLPQILDPSLPFEWDMLDQFTPTAKLVHFTTMPTQPWQPWPEHMRYLPHRDETAVEVWRELLAEATA